MERLKHFLKNLICVELGVCIGQIIQKCQDYQVHPEVYQVQSAPWYTDIYISLLFTLIVVAITGIIYGIISYRIK